MSDLRQTLEFLRGNPDYLALDGRQKDGIRVDLRYARAENFMGRDVYGDLTEAFLHRVAGEMLLAAAARLRSERPDHSLLILDALRPRSIQRVLWAHVEGTPNEAYVANPDRGSVHNYGLAVDLTVIDGRGRELDMGTGFDAFTPLSEPRLEERFRAEGRLTDAHLANRHVLRDAMTGAGFRQLPHEWWHFDALEREKIRGGDFRLIE